MAYFAKKMKYCANENSFVALVMIAKKKGGKPVKFILYKYLGGSIGIHQMIEFGAEKDAIKAFPYGLGGFWGDIENIEAWKRTTDWLDDVAVGGSYKIHSDGDWVKVGRPAIWKKRRKKIRPKFGELGHLLIIRQSYLRDLKRELHDTNHALDDILYCYEERGDEVSRDNLTVEEKNEVYELELEIESVENLISGIERKISALKAEMKFKSNNRR